MNQVVLNESTSDSESNLIHEIDQNQIHMSLSAATDFSNRPMILPSANKTKKQKRHTKMQRLAQLPIHPYLLGNAVCTECSRNDEEGIIMIQNSEKNEAEESESLLISLYVDSLESPSQITELQSVIRSLPHVQNVSIQENQKLVKVHCHKTEEIKSTKIAAEVIIELLNKYGFQGCRQVVQSQELSTTDHSSVVRSKLYVSGICCSSECPAIRKVLLACPGVMKVQINIPAKIVHIRHDPEKASIQDLSITLFQQGFESKIIHDGAASSQLQNPTLASYLSLAKDEDDSSNPQNGSQIIVATGESNEHSLEIQPPNYEDAKHEDIQDDERMSLQIHVLLSGFFWLLSMLGYIGGDWEYLQYFGLLSVVFGIPPVAIKALRTLRRCQFDANCMMVLAALGALALQEFDEAASVAFLFSISDYLEAKATYRARKALRSILNLRPEYARVIHPTTQEIIITPADHVKVGSLISVRTGDKIVADGVVVEGTTSVDESSLTGEAIPITKGPEDSVSGGSINVGNSPIIVRTETTVEDSAVSRLIRLVEEGQANQSPTEMLVDTFARSYTPFVILLAASMCTFPWLINHDTGRYWTLNGLIIILIACPCALTISTPVTYAAGLAACAQRGVIVKGGATLEALGNVHTVVLDKTGTLTDGNFVVSRLETVGNQISRTELLELLILLESPSTHPLSVALMTAARDEGIGLPNNRVVRNHTLLKGEGVMADVDGQQVYVGNKRLFCRLGMYEALNSSGHWSEDASEGGGTVGFVGIDGKGIVGAFCVTDTIREGAKEMISDLMSSNINVVMLTGDGEGAAQSVAKRVGLVSSSVHSQLLPEDKLRFVEALSQPYLNSILCLRRRPCIVMVGDGINDAPALAVADVGVAMGEGAALAMEMSDVTLMDSKLSKVVYTINMGKKVVVTIQENIFLSVLVKVIVVALTFLGKMTLLTAIASDLGIMLLVTLNGVKLLPSNTSDASNDNIRKRGFKKAYMFIDQDRDQELEIV
jgi:Zn2+/Cd2+-exporting ATPase